MSDTSAQRRITLGWFLEPGTPLGPFEGLVLPGYTTASTTSRLHGSNDCSRLRSATTTRAVDFSLDQQSVTRLCDGITCHWEISADHPLVEFTEALYAFKRIAPEEQEPDDSEEEITDEESGARREPEGSAEEDDADTRWEKRKLAEEALFTWRYDQQMLVKAASRLPAYPWLRMWAEPRVEAMERKVERKRQAAAAFFTPRDRSRSRRSPDRPGCLGGLRVRDPRR